MCVCGEDVFAKRFILINRLLSSSNAINVSIDGDIVKRYYLRRTRPLSRRAVE